jgi:hypothetical protein
VELRRRRAAMLCAYAERQAVAQAAGVMTDRWQERAALARYSQYASDPWGRVTRPAPATARTGPKIAVRVHVERPVQPPGCHPDPGCLRLSPRPASPACWSGLGRRPSCRSRRTRTCSGMPADMRLPTEDTIQGRCRLTSVTRTSSTRCATPSCRRRGSKIFGGSELSQMATRKSVP